MRLSRLVVRDRITWNGVVLRRFSLSEKEKEARLVNPKYYKEYDRWFFRLMYNYRDDVHLQNPHPYDKYNLDFQKLNSEAILMRKHQEEKIELEAKGLDYRDVMVDIETFRLRDPIIEHLKDIRKPVPPEHYFLIHSMWYLLAALLFKTFVILGHKYRDYKQDIKDKHREEEELLSEQRILEENMQNSKLILRGKAPQNINRFDFENGRNSVLEAHAQSLRYLGVDRKEFRNTPTK
jgi:hypothetical protein